MTGGIEKRLWIGVDGVPRAQPRPRGVGRRFVSVANPKAKLWAGLVEREVRKAVAGLKEAERGWLAGPVSLRLDFMMPTGLTGRMGRPHDIKPDGDNLAKLVMDAMERAGCLPGGDQRVTDLQVSKVWHSKGGVVITLGALPEPPETGAGSAKRPDWLG